uniref:NADH-ubiquinone oxidoreductase chain 5 n=1 Tax=Litigonotus ghinii TaxID=3104745 RepID=A0AAU8MIN6_9BILA
MDLTVVFDFASLAFGSLVLMISFSVCLYSLSYMFHDARSSGFFILVFLFVMSMLILTMVGSFVCLLLGWDGLGVTSFLLIIYYQNSTSTSAGLITFFVNRLGDVFLLISIALFFMDVSGGYMFFSSDWGCMLGACALLVTGAATKSAQMPFSVWLPAAMAAPTPVSALVHSSTLVTAGVYLLIRFSSYFYGMWVIWVMMVVGGVLTSIMAGTCAVFERDMKKVIAFSTMSQLGVMVYSIGFGLVLFSLFHLFMHALFKALLFLCAGELIHNMSGYQDFRVYGGLGSYFPFTTAILGGSLLSMAGFVFFSGFYSKDQIWEVFEFSGLWGWVLVSAVFLTVLLTVAYSVRLFMGVGLVDTGSHPFISVGNGDRFMTASMVGLFAMSVFGGSLFVSFVDGLVSEAICLTYQEKLVLLSTTFLGTLLWLGLRGLSAMRKDLEARATSAFLSMWFLVYLSSHGFVTGMFNVVSYVKTVLDAGWFEWLSGSGVYTLAVRGADFSSGFSRSGWSVLGLFAGCVFLAILWTFI